MWRVLVMRRDGKVGQFKFHHEFSAWVAVREMAALDVYAVVIPPVLPM